MLYTQNLSDLFSKQRNRFRPFVAAIALLSPLICRAVPSAEREVRAVVSSGDLEYSSPVERSEEGMPVGNGRMGSLVWTTPDALRFQINRVDVFGVSAASTSFPRADSDYAAGCGYVDIHVASGGDEVFTGADFGQSLSIYDGQMTARGKGLSARVLAWPERDVIAVEIDDQRERPEAINIDLRMLRYAVEYIRGRNYELARDHVVEIHTANHVARSQLHIRDGGIALTQRFSEGDFFDASAVAIRLIGREGRARYLNESTVQLSAAPGRGRFTVLIASAASVDPEADEAGIAFAELQSATERGFDRLRRETADWWRDYWSRGYVRLNSADGQADFIGANYHYFLYIVGASSRGDYAPRFGGMLWRTTGDLSRWGSQYWWTNMNAYYAGLMTANRLELMDPLFDLYTEALESFAIAARQQWGSEGIWIPEVIFFDGLETLPDDIASELQDLVLARKPFEERSARFEAFAEVRNRLHARWNFQADGEWVDGHYIIPTKGAGIFGHCTHILGVAARIGALAWDRYQYTMDERWLRERAYPFIQGAAEFYRTFPNLRLGDDGRYHIHHVNHGEGQWNSSDSVYEIRAMHLAFSLAIRSSEILGVDGDLREQWKETLERLPPLPPHDYLPLGTGFIYPGPGAIEPLGVDRKWKERFLGFNRLGSFIDPPGIGGAQIFRNRLRLREGPGAIDCENLGALANRIHEAMLSSDSPETAGSPVLELFHEWPRDWDAEFTLRARGAFVVSAKQSGGKVDAVHLVSEAGAECQMRNPWKGAAVVLSRAGKADEVIRGPVLIFSTQVGEAIDLRPERN